jgi:transcriptional regulator with XRE-family HTH domain
LTQQELADLLGRPQSIVTNYENGERRLDVVEFLEIAEHLDADPHRILRRVAKAR